MLNRFGLAALASGLLLALAGTVPAAKKSAPITKPKLIPDAKVVDLFEGMDQKQLHVFLKLKNSKTGNLFVENKTGQPLTVKLPEAFVGVHVLNQFQQPGNSFGSLGSGGQQQGGGGQSTGGGAQSSFGSGQQSGNNFFSVPPEKIVRLPVNMVCLEHGKPEPSVRMTYRVAPVEAMSSDPVLKQLLRMVSRGQVNSKAAQAAAWHLANGKTFRELAAMKFDRAGNQPDPPQFSYSELKIAQTLIAEARKLAEKPHEPNKPRPARPRQLTRR